MSLQDELLDYLRGRFPHVRIMDDSHPRVIWDEQTDHAIRWDDCDEGSEGVNEACDAFVAGWRAARATSTASEGRT